MTDGWSAEGSRPPAPAQWLRDQEAPFEGWDFSYLRGRFSEDELPWDYPSSARALLGRARSALDMATGGGEVFASFTPFPPLTVAIEGYPPNVSIAGKRLDPLGVRVVQCGEVEPLPFGAGTFDLVLNRHGGLRVEEIERVLAMGGHFLTQQVGGNLEDLEGRFGAQPQWPENVLAKVVERLRALGFDILQAEEFHGHVTFGDVGAIVYFLRAIPWVVPGFSVERDRGVLLALQDDLERGKSLSFTSGHFFIHARKPAQ